MARIEIFEDKAGGWRWRLRADNGEITATSEGYTSQRDAERGAQDAKLGFSLADEVPVERVDT